MKRLIKKLFAIIVLISFFLSAWLWSNYQTFLESAIDLKSAEQKFVIVAGENPTQILTNLHQQEIIKEPAYFKLYLKLSGNGRQIKAGEYLLEKDMTPVEMIALFISGKSVSYKITIPEGWSFKQLRQSLNQNEFLAHNTLALSDEELMIKLGYEGKHPEGLFFPETYQFTRGDSDLKILSNLAKKMQQVLDVEWANKADNLLLKTPYEALIMASIIEKETGVGHERDEISGVFARRMKINMRLQTDPTVIYGMGERYKGNIRRKDLREDTPYNTYVHNGLPPTPICLPGKAAIYAALHPKKGKTLYFVGKGDGTHYFSKNLKEHNAAVRKYQLKK